MSEARHATLIAGDLQKLVTTAPEHADLIREAASALYRQAAIIAEMKAVFRR